jgi:hypothetical protein
MDSQEAANLAQIQNTRLTRWLLLLTIIQIVSPFVFYWLTKPHDSAGGGILMPPWLPVVFFVTSFVVTTIALLVVASKRWRNNRLTSDLSRLEADRANLRVERQDAWDKAKEANNNALEARREVLQAKEQQRIAETEMEGVRSRLADTKGQLDNLEWLKEIADAQAMNIQLNVSITAVVPYDLILTGDRSHRRVTLGLRVFNDSVFKISVLSDEITGSLGFGEETLGEEVKAIIDLDRPPIENLQRKTEETLVLDQHLTNAEVDLISRALDDPDAFFWLHALRIPISGGKAFPQVNRQVIRLRREKARVYLKDFRLINV